MKTQSLIINGLIHREKGWTPDEQTAFLNEFIALVEKWEASTATSLDAKNDDDYQDLD